MERTLADLHLHTVFSDGSLQDISSFAMNHRVISVTDHNSIGFFQNPPVACDKTRIVIGCEVTVNKIPDILVYFPNLKCYSYALENELAGLRSAEAHIIQSCYKKLGYTDWAHDIDRAFPKNQVIKDARTRDLAAIIHLHRNHLEYDDGNFDRIDLMEARKMRSDFAVETSFSFRKDIAFELAKRFNGETFLAHPIRTAIRQSNFRGNNGVDLSGELKSLLNQFWNHGGKGVEWEFFPAEYMNRYNLDAALLQHMREVVLGFVSQKQIHLSIGTDSHSMKDFEESQRWLCVQFPRIYSFLPPWVK